MNILNIERHVLALLQPLTGDRASGSVRMKAEAGQSPTIAVGQFLLPVVGGAVRPDLAFKVVGEGSTTITEAGTTVSVVSNVGGKRHNLEANTLFVLDSGVSGVDPTTVRSTAAFTNGADPETDLALWGAISYETFGAQPSLDAFRSSIGGKFPAVLLHWEGSDPADGQATSATNRGTHRGAASTDYSETFELVLIVSKETSENDRRGLAIRILDAMTALLVDRRAVDGVAFSSTGGIYVKRRYPIADRDELLYRAFRLYGLELTVQNVVTQTDSRTFNPLRYFNSAFTTPDGLRIV